MKTSSLLRFALVAVVTGACSSLLAALEELRAAIQQARDETVLISHKFGGKLEAMAGAMSSMIKAP